MIIIYDKTRAVEVKIPNNLSKLSSVLLLRNTETKENYRIVIQDKDVSPFFYVFDYNFSDLPDGEYEYDLGANVGLLRIESDMDKVVYRESMTFKAYEA